MTGWVRTKLGDVLPFKYGKNLPDRVRSHTGEFKVASSAGFVDTHCEPLTNGPCVVIGRKGSIGTVFYSAEPVFPIDTTFYVEGSTEADIRFAYYLLLTLPLRNMNNDSAVPGLNRSQAEALQIDLPPLNEQRGIAETLGAIDDKIESNRRLVTRIPDLIRATVEACVDDEAEVLPVVELAEFVNGGAYTKGASGTGRMVIRIKDLNSGPGASTVYNDLSVPDNKIARPGDLLMSWSGSLGVYRWSRDEAIINQHIFKVLPKDFPAWLVFDRLEAVIEIFQGIAKDKATTMGHIQRGHLVSTTIEVPTTSAIVRLDERLGPVWERLLLAEREIHRLESLREALLPELLSGRIRVPEAEVAA